MKYLIIALFALNASAQTKPKKPRLPHKSEVLVYVEGGSKITCKVEATTFPELEKLTEYTKDRLDVSISIEPVNQ